MRFWIYALIGIVVGYLIYPYLGGGPPRVILPDNPDGHPVLPEGVTRKVLIIGGGVGGLSAALELAQRGFEVTLKDKENDIGGRYRSHKVNILGEEFQLSTGFHACFHNYHNFKRIRQSLGVSDHYVSWQENHFAFRDYEWENVYSSGPWPLNLVAMIIRSPNLSLWTAMKAWRVSMGFLFYNHDDVYEMYDHLTYDEWAETCGVVPAFGDIWLKPGISASFDEVATFSAAEFLLFSHFYFISGAEAEHRDYSAVNSGKALIDPWREKLKDLGVRFELGQEVTALGFDKKSEKVTHDVSSPSQIYDHVILAVDVGSAKEIISESVNHKAGVSPKVASALVKIRDDLKHLTKAKPFKILKVWFDKQLERDRHYAVLQTPQHHPINLVVQLHQVEEQHRNWAAKTGGSVMEFHLYTWSHGDIEDGKIWQIIAPTVRDIYPEVIDKKFKILASHVVSGNSCAAFKNGTAKYRPRASYPSKCGISNLGLAGDWLRTDYPSALTERAVSTAIESVNQILSAEGVKQIPIVVTTSSGPGFI